MSCPQWWIRCLNPCCGSTYLLRAISMSTCPHSFEAISRPFSPVFSPFFRRSPRLAAKIQETGTKTRKDGPKRSKHGGPKTPS